MTERWRPIDGFPRYQVSDLGRVMSFQRGSARIMAPVPDSDGYATVRLVASGRGTRFKTHRIVCATFHGPPPAGHEVCHIDGDKTNNAADNLRWGTRSDNVRDAMRHGTHRLRRATADEMARGSTHHSAKLTERVVIEARARHARGESGRALAKEFGVTSANMSAALRGDSWSRAASDAPKGVTAHE